MNISSTILRFPQNRVWRTYPGGKVLDELANKSAPADSHFPEDWIASTTRAINPGREDVEEGVSTALVGDQEMRFDKLLSEHAEALLGKQHVEQFGPQMMLLVKLLDSAVRLHFQCHPTAAFSRKYLGAKSGKAEAYHILSIREDVKEPYVYLGFQRPPSRERLKRWIESQNIAAIEGCFDKIRVKPGDTLFIPGGFPHAIGEGILMVEIMEPSDLAVRFEFEKAGYVLPEKARFMGKGLDFCLDVFDYRAVAEEEVRRQYMFEPRPVDGLQGDGQMYALIGPETTPCYRVGIANVDGKARAGRIGPLIGIVTMGSGAIHTAAETVELKQYDKIMIPAGLEGFEIESKGEMRLLQCFPPSEAF